MQIPLNENAYSECETAQPENNNGIECGVEGVIAFSENGNAIPQLCNAVSELVQALPETTTEKYTYLNIDEVWKGVVDNLKDKLSPSSLSAWILPIRAEAQGATLILCCPSQFAMDWISGKYLDIIVGSLPKNSMVNKVIVRCDERFA